MGARMMSLARIAILGAPLGWALWMGGCAGRSGQQPGTEMPSAATTTPNGSPVTPTPTSTPSPSPKGVIVPGDPSSGTAGLGSGTGKVDTTTGTSGSRVKPGDTGDGK